MSHRHRIACLAEEERVIFVAQSCNLLYHLAATHTKAMKDRIRRCHRKILFVIPYWIRNTQKK
jgi:hypothetical protein